MNRLSRRICSPEYAKISRATAIALGFIRGRMYRDAVNRCVNILLYYPEGCSANCAYCGLAKRRPGQYHEKSFIHVDWPLYPFDQIIDGINHAPGYVKRSCISMITNGKAGDDTIKMARRLKKETEVPVSVLLSPTLIKEDDLVVLKDMGVDKVGIALDLANKQLFERYRGNGVGGPHRYERYWQTMETSLKVFGRYQVGVHLMVGMGETEYEMVRLMDELWNMGVANHLFSFYAEDGSVLADRPQPPWSSYLRIQLARYLIESGRSRHNDMGFDPEGRITHFGLEETVLMEIINSGTPFMTTGCLGPDGRVACNRPFGNCLPGPRQWNYPYLPNGEELGLVIEKIFLKG
ncbi:MAG: radical SAM protein [Deltaproteobacteria bacterium]|nr:radical SAM protein [Deltaproteobacteria bacterium]MBW2136551.1 radical SAM protein [Deltaproteobacteria bacterium]